MIPDSLTTDTITFLGTAGARFMVMRQLAASGGIWLELGNTRLLLDPGPGSLVQAIKRKKNPETMDAILLSSDLKPKTAILSHFGMPVWEAGPDKLAAAMTERTGINIVAAMDGMVFDMATLSCVSSPVQQTE